MRLCEFLKNKKRRFSFSFELYRQYLRQNQKEILENGMNST